MDLSAWDAGHIRLAGVGIILFGLLAWIAVGALSGSLALSQIFTLLPATVAGGFLLARARRCENRTADRL